MPHYEWRIWITRKRERAYRAYSQTEEGARRIAEGHMRHEGLTSDYVIERVERVAEVDTQWNRKVDQP